MRTLHCLVALTAVTALAAGCSSSSNGLKSKSGKQIVAAAVAATKKQSSFRFSEKSVESGSAVSIVGDVGTTSGEQEITIRDGAQTGHVSLMVVKKTAYLEGDTLGLESYTGMSKTDSAKLAGTWIAIPSSNSDFSQLTESLIVKTAASALVYLSGTLVRGKTSTQLGKKVVGVTSTQKSKTGSLNLTLYVSSTGAALPVSVTGTRTASKVKSTIVATFTKWGEKVQRSAPKKSVPFADIEALLG